MQNEVREADAPVTEQQIRSKSRLAAAQFGRLELSPKNYYLNVNLGQNNHIRVTFGH
jgi:hypothetical protein